MGRLKIEEIIQHCEHKVEQSERIYGLKMLENEDIGNIIVKEYWEHKQVLEYLTQLQAYKAAEEAGLLVYLPYKNMNPNADIQVITSDRDTAILSVKVPGCCSQCELEREEVANRINYCSITGDHYVEGKSTRPNECPLLPLNTKR